MKSVKMLLTSCLLIAAMALSGCGGAEKKPEAKPAAGPQTIKLAHVVNEKDGFHIAALKFKELVEARTKGAVKVEVFPNASLGDERTLIEGMQIGTIAMGVITNGPVANFLPDKIANQLKPLLRFQLSWQGDFNLAVGAAVGTFKRVSGFPELRRFMRCPCGHIARLFVFKVRVFFTGILSLTRNIIGMRRGVAFPAGFYAEVIGCHAVYPAEGAHRF